MVEAPRTWESMMWRMISLLFVVRASARSNVTSSPGKDFPADRFVRAGPAGRVAVASPNRYDGCNAKFKPGRPPTPSVHVTNKFECSLRASPLRVYGAGTWATTPCALVQNPSHLARRFTLALFELCVHHPPLGLSLPASIDPPHLLRRPPALLVLALARPCLFLSGSPSCSSTYEGESPNKQQQQR
jgi:hypothetical protein